MAYIIWNRDTGQYQVEDNVYKAQSMAQRMGGNVAITPLEQHVLNLTNGLPFDPDGGEYDYETAIRMGVQPNERGKWPSRAPNGQLLKGAGHETFHKTVAGEAQAGYEIHKGDDGKYYSEASLPPPTIPEPVLGESIDDVLARRDAMEANQQASVAQQEEVDRINAMVSGLYAQNDADARRNAALAQSDAVEKQRWYDQTMSNINDRVAFGTQQALRDQSLLANSQGVSEEQLRGPNYYETQAHQFGPSVPLGESLPVGDPSPPPASSPIEEQKTILKQQLGQPTKIWDWDNPNIVTYSTYGDQPRPPTPERTPGVPGVNFIRPPTIPSNVVTDGYGAPVKTSSGYLTHRTDEQIAQDENDPFWWM